MVHYIVHYIVHHMVHCIVQYTAELFAFHTQAAPTSLDVHWGDRT